MRRYDEPRRFTEVYSEFMISRRKQPLKMKRITFSRSETKIESISLNVTSTISPKISIPTEHFAIQFQYLANLKISCAMLPVIVPLPFVPLLLRVLFNC